MSKLKLKGYIINRKFMLIGLLLAVFIFTVLGTITASLGVTVKRTPRIVKEKFNNSLTATKNLAMGLNKAIGDLQACKEDIDQAIDDINDWLTSIKRARGERTQINGLYQKTGLVYQNDFEYGFSYIEKSKNATKCITAATTHLKGQLK